MAYQGISTGTTPNDGLGDSLATGAVKINSNFSEIYTALGDGTVINRAVNVGTGITGGGTLNSDVTISVDSSVVRTSGDQTIGGNKTFTGAVTINGIIPVGGIIMWSGSIATIPIGWALCDGTNSTPDLRNRFIVGATSDASTGVTFDADTGAVSGSYAPGNTGGSVAHQLTIAEMPAHTHSYNQAFFRPNSAGSAPVNLASGNSPQNTTSQGGSDYHENRPPYYALAFIMRTT